MEKKKKKTILAKPKKLSISLSLKKNLNLYEDDFYKWTKKQANLLKKKELSELDLKNLKEEIESLGRNDKRSLRSQTIRLLMHLLKKEYQPEKDLSNSWDSSINDAKREIKFLIEDSPSLMNELKKMFEEAYEYARKDASAETKKDITTFPETSPWTIEEIFPDLSKKDKK